MRPNDIKFGNLSFTAVASQPSPGTLTRPAPGLLKARSRQLRERATPALRRGARALLDRLGVQVRRAGKATLVFSRVPVETVKLGGGSYVLSTDGTKPVAVAGLGPVAAPPAARVQPLGKGSALVSHPDTAERHVFDTHRVLHHRMTTEHVAEGLRRYNVDWVLDVGANKGQYARQLRRAGYTGRIVSFEPVPEMFAELERNAATDPDWSVHHCALGRADGTVAMNVVAGSMSSILPPSAFGNQRYKRFQNISSIEVPVRRLEQVLDEILPSGSAAGSEPTGGTGPRIYLKMDTQGYDVEVFAGLGARMRDVVGMQSELALLQIYEGMPRLPQAIETFEAEGFEITGMFPVTRETHTGRVLEFDCVLARAEALEAT